MEWNAMHRPLEPPRGYEHFYTKEAVFPGLKREWHKKESLHDYVQGLNKAWKMYRHDFVYDPEVAKIEQQFGISQDQEAEKKAAAVLRQAKRTVKSGLASADELLDDAHSKAPDAQKLVKNRIDVLFAAMNEFSQGYREAVGGKWKLWDEDDDIKEPTVPHNPKSKAHNQRTRPPSPMIGKHN